MKYTYTRLQVLNYEACKKFYRDILELSVAFESNKYTELETGQTRITLLDREKLTDIIGKPNVAAYGSGDGIALSFEVSDLNESCQKLKAKGVEFINDPWSFPDWGYKSTFFPRSRWQFSGTDAATFISEAGEVKRLANGDRFCWLFSL